MIWQDWIDIFNYILQNNTNDIINIEESLKNIKVSYWDLLSQSPTGYNPYETIHKIILDSLIYKNIIIEDFTIIAKTKLKADLLSGIDVSTLEKSNNIYILEYFNNNKINFLSEVIIESNNRIVDLINTTSNITLDTRENCLDIFTQKCTHFLRLSPPPYNNVINPHIGSNQQINNDIRFGLLYNDYIEMKSINPNINFSKLVDLYLTEWDGKWLGKEKVLLNKATLSNIMDQYQIRIRFYWKRFRTT